ILQRAHPAHHVELRQEVVEIERSGAQFALQPGSVFGFHRFGSFFDETDDIAHSKNSSREPLWNKKLKLIELFTGACEFDWTMGDLTHRQSCAAASVAIELRQNDSCDRQCSVETARDADRLLTGCSIHNE